MFDFTGRMEVLVEDLVRRLPALAHIRTDTLLLTLSRARRGGLSGTFARIYPLRFEGGADRFTRRVGRALQTYEMPPVFHDGRRIFYIITFLLPRFQNLPFETKLATVIHELYHVGVACDGDIRRLPGKNFAHGYSREAYDRLMTRLAGDYLRAAADAELTGFLECDFRALERRYGGVSGLRASPPLPRLVATEPAPERSRPRPGRPASVPGPPYTPAPRRPDRAGLPPGGQLAFPFPEADRRARRRANAPAGEPDGRGYRSGSSRTATRSAFR